LKSIFPFPVSRFVFLFMFIYVYSVRSILNLKVHYHITPLLYNSNAKQIGGKDGAIWPFKGVEDEGQEGEGLKEKAGGDG